MAVLADADRASCYSDFVAELGQARESFGLVTKADIRAALNGLDDFLSTNAVSINQAIPQPARGVLTVAQKARLLRWVVTYRFSKGA